MKMIYSNRADIENCISLTKMLNGFDGMTFNPADTARVVNCLYDLGFENSIDALVNYCSLSRESVQTYHPENVLIAARILYVPKDARIMLPALNLGRADMDEPVNRSILPIFPLHLCSDLPLLLIGGYLIGGEGRSPLEYVMWCKQNGKMRSSPLIPPGNPLKAVDEFLESANWKLLQPEQFHYRMLRAQALRATAPALHVGNEQIRDLISSARYEDIWQKYIKQFESFNIKWSRNEGYVRMK